MKKLAVFISLIFLISSCFLFKPYKKTKFVYTYNGEIKSIPLEVPKGYLKQEQKDTAGITLQTFYYSGGALLYTAYLSDTTIELQPIDTAKHQPLMHRLGGLIYKGLDEKDLYYREIRRGHLRFGYRYVPRAFEVQFDDATDFASLQKQ